MALSGIVLFTKKPSCTSFASLYEIKKALGTKKVGHTGTLDAFAQGLLVVCVGNLTHLSGLITAASKTYQAVIAFGNATDTLDYTGNITKSAPLPTVQDFKLAIAKYSGDLLQSPPAFSAVHIGGKRSYELARSGKEVCLPSKKITVYSNKILDLKVVRGQVRYALVEFCVSCGTYIRVLASDIASSCGSEAHLLGLLRTKVGDFSLENALECKSCSNFSIKHEIAYSKKCTKPKEISPKAIQEALLPMTKDLALKCGLCPLVLKNDICENAFMHGGKLKIDMFQACNTQAKSFAVFNLASKFLGCIYAENGKDFYYNFVAN